MSFQPQEVDPQELPPPNLKGLDVVKWFASFYECDEAQVDAFVEDLLQQTAPNNQKRKELYHSLSVWSGVVRRCSLQTM